MCCLATCGHITATNCPKRPPSEPPSSVCLLPAPRGQARPTIARYKLPQAKQRGPSNMEGRGRGPSVMDGGGISAQPVPQAMGVQAGCPGPTGTSLGQRCWPLASTRPAPPRRVSLIYAGSSTLPLVELVPVAADHVPKVFYFHAAQCSR